MTIGARLKLIRNRKGITLKKLSEDIGVNYSTLSNYERDYRIPELKTLIKISEYYNLPIDYIVGNYTVQRYVEYEKFLKVFNKKIIPVVSLKNVDLPFQEAINEKYFIDMIVMPNNTDADFGVIIENKQFFPDLDIGDVAIVSQKFDLYGDGDLFLVDYFGSPLGFKYITAINDGFLIHTNKGIKGAEYVAFDMDDFMGHTLGVVSAIIKRQSNGVKLEEELRRQEEENNQK